MRYKAGIETRGRILEATRHLISEEGLDGTTIKAICDTSGVLPGSFYNLFDSKEQAIMAVVREAIDAIDPDPETHRVRPSLRSGRGLRSLPPRADGLGPCLHKTGCLRRAGKLRIERACSPPSRRAGDQIRLGDQGRTPRPRCSRSRTSCRDIGQRSQRNCPPQGDGRLFRSRHARAGSPR